MLQQSDEYNLLHKVKAGDRIAFASLYHSHVQRLCLISYKITGDKGVAEDLVQDFFVNFWIKKEQLRFTTSFSAYASRSVYYASLNAIRNTKKIVGIEEASVVFDSVDLLEEDHLAVYRERLNLAIENLPPQRRKIFEKICINGLSYADVAESMGISINTVKVHMSKAYRTLKEELNLDTSALIGVFVFFFLK
jgi:RNA polymerase sigma-70 factor (ECF subfamily)